MGKVINRGFVTDPNDPVFKEGWKVSISPGFGSLQVCIFTRFVPVIMYRQRRWCC
jgi:hypothetical protein